jgi:hypothetical protein
LRATLALLLLLTSTLQTVVAQAHIHVPVPASSQATYVSADSNPLATPAPADNEDRSKRSHGDPSSTCPLCQAHSLGGAPLAQCAPSSFVPTFATSMVPVSREPVFVTAAVSYHWTGRGPPRA